MRDDQLDVALGQLSAQGITVVAAVTDEPLEFLGFEMASSFS